MHNKSTKPKTFTDGARPRAPFFCNKKNLSVPGSRQSSAAKEKNALLFPKDAAENLHGSRTKSAKETSRKVRKVREVLKNGREALAWN